MSHDFRPRGPEVPGLHGLETSRTLTIIGAERYTDYAEFRQIVTPYLSPPTGPREGFKGDTGQLGTLLSHGTTGTFKMTQQLANDNHVTFQSLKGDTSQPFEIDEPMRIQIQQKCQQILVFVDPKSVQLWEWVNYARSVGKSCVVFNIQIDSATQTPETAMSRSPYPYSIPGIPMAITRVAPTPPTTLTSVHPETQKAMETQKVSSRVEVEAPTEPLDRAGRLPPWGVDHIPDSQLSTPQIAVPSASVDSKSESTASSSAPTTPMSGRPSGAGSIKLKILPHPVYGVSQPRLVIRPKLPSQIIAQDWTVSRICEQAVPPGWESVFTDAALELRQISELLETDEQRSMIVPLKKHLFRALEVLPMSKVRVIIWGQDPYHQLLSHGEPRAVGLSFSVSREDDVPRSLVNIYREISNNLPDFIIPKHGDLSSWCRQGVLLLNSSLTCRVNDPNSHARYGIWLPFIVRLIRGIEQVRPKCIHLLWGKEALKIKQHISERGIVLTASHPSPLSAEKGFFGCRHFINVNDTLKGFGEDPIDWNLPS